MFFLFLERGEGREKERERNTHVWENRHQSVASHTPTLGTWTTTQACALTGNWTGDLLVCTVALNPQSHTSQGFFPNILNQTNRPLDTTQGAMYIHSFSHKRHSNVYCSDPCIGDIFRLNCLSGLSLNLVIMKHHLFLTFFFVLRKQANPFVIQV